MPFTDKLKHWAAHTPGHTAVVVGQDSLSYAGLLAAACQRPSEVHGVSVIKDASGTSLAVQLCAAALAERTAVVLDAGWPEALQRRLSSLAQSWDGPGNPGPPPFLLGLSSGTSGTPKGFLRSADSWRESFIQSCRYFSVTPSTVTLAPGPLAASMNLYALGESIHAGGTFVVLEQFSPDAALAAIRDHGVNRLVLVPAVLEILARHALAKGADGGVLAQIVCAGSALPPHTVALARQWAPHAVIQQYYGAAELGFVAASTLAPEHHETAPGGVGNVFPGVELSILDDEGHEMPAGAYGNISVKSPYLCDGYAWGDDSLAFTALGPGGWHTVRDQGSIDELGVLHVAGRASDMILTAGNNVYPHAVEEALHHGAASVDLVVAGIPDPLRGQKVVAAFHRRRSGQALANAEILRQLRQVSATLPAAQRPAQYFEIAELPLTGSGKTSRALLAQWITEGDLRVTRLF